MYSYDRRVYVAHTAGQTVTLRKTFRDTKQGIAVDRIGIGGGEKYEEGIDTFEMLSKSMGFTPYGNKPFIPFFKVRSTRTGKEFDLPEYFFGVGTQGQSRNPVDEAFKYLQQALRKAGLFETFRRTKSTRRNGRALKLDFGQSPLAPEYVLDALAQHPNIRVRSREDIAVLVPSGDTTFSERPITLDVRGINRNELHGLELY